MNRKLFSTLFSLLVVLVLGVAAAAAQEPSPDEAPSSEDESNQIVLNADVSAQAALGTAFTYQGRLSENGNPANGPYDFEFKLFDLASGGNQLGSTIIKGDVSVNDGAFMVQLGFGKGVFTGGTRYLEIGVRPGNDSGAYTSLSPRAIIHPVPYALSLKPGATIKAKDRALTLTSANGNGTHINAATLFLRNTNDQGIGLWNHTTSSDAALVVANSGSGPLIKGFGNNGGGHDFLVQNDGRVFIESNSGVSHIRGAALQVHQTNRSTGIALWATSQGKDTTLVLSNDGSGPLIKGFGNNGGGHDFLVHNDGTVVTTKLQITGGSDLSERFDIRDPLHNLAPTPGMVACIGSEKPGELIICSQEYDQTVAGIISGAGGIKPGMLMGQEGSAADGEYPVALTGRVYVQADASNGAIQPGDLLTSSDIPGHAMKVTDYEQAQGAILGKAMTPLNEGQGLVLVLVSLQ